MGELEEDKVSVANYIALGTMMGLSARESLQLPCGVFNDMAELYMRRKGISQDTLDD